MSSSKLIYNVIFILLIAFAASALQKGNFKRNFQNKLALNKRQKNNLKLVGLKTSTASDIVSNSKTAITAINDILTIYLSDKTATSQLETTAEYITKLKKVSNLLGSLGPVLSFASVFWDLASDQKDPVLTQLNLLSEQISDLKTDVVNGFQNLENTVEYSSLKGLYSAYSNEINSCMEWLAVIRDEIKNKTTNQVSEGQLNASCEYYYKTLNGIFDFVQPSSSLSFNFFNVVSDKYHGGCKILAEMSMSLGLYLMNAVSSYYAYLTHLNSSLTYTIFDTKMENFWTVFQTKMNTCYSNAASNILTYFKQIYSSYTDYSTAAKSIFNSFEAKWGDSYAQYRLIVAKTVDGESDSDYDNYYCSGSNIYCYRKNSLFYILILYQSGDVSLNWSNAYNHAVYLGNNIGSHYYVVYSSIYDCKEMLTEYSASVVGYRAAFCFRSYMQSVSSASYNNLLPWTNAIYTNTVKKTTSTTEGAYYQFLFGAFC